MILPSFERGSVWLAGAGPGDAGLLTLLAAHGLKHADIILYDALVSPEVLALAGPQAIQEFVGKRCGTHSLTQAQITARIIECVRDGKRVLRLKGGDPFTFARGAEEAAALATAGIPFRVISGITAGIGGLAAAGIPLTCRDTNTVVSFITGHGASGALPEDINWQALAASSPVIVAYMARKTLPQIAAKLMAAGRDGAEPVAIICNATLSTQQVFLTTLAEAGVVVLPEAPAIIVIGDVVNRREIGL